MKIIEIVNRTPYIGLCSDQIRILNPDPNLYVQISDLIMNLLYRNGYPLYQFELNPNPNILKSILLCSLLISSDMFSFRKMGKVLCGNLEIG